MTPNEKVQNIEDAAKQMVVELKQLHPCIVTDDMAIGNQSELYTDLFSSVETLLVALLAQRDKEIREEESKLYQETNISELVSKMESEIEEDGDMHDEDCPCNSELPDECDCETMLWAKMRCREWMGKVNRMWVVNLQEHRKHCTPDGNKSLTRIKKALTNN